MEILIHYWLLPTLFVVARIWCLSAHAYSRLIEWISVGQMLQKSVTEKTVFMPVNIYLEWCLLESESRHVPLNIHAGSQNFPCWFRIPYYQLGVKSGIIIGSPNFYTCQSEILTCLCTGLIQAFPDIKKSDWTPGGFHINSILYLFI